MRKSIIVLLGAMMAILFSPFTVLAQEKQSYAFLDYPDQIPTEIVVSDRNNVETIKTLSAVDTFFVGNFQLGVSEGLPQSELDRFDGIVASLDKNQFIFFRGTADHARWSGRYKDYESPRLNLGLAMTRARWAQNRAGRGKILLPMLEAERRGVWVYVVTYDNIEAQALRPIQRDTVYSIEEHYFYTYDTVYVAGTSDVSFGLGLGVAGLFVFTDDRQDYIAPTVRTMLDFGREHQLALDVGWRPKDASEDEEAVQGDRMETIVALSYTNWLSEWGGLAVSGIYATESIKEVNEYLESSAGLAIGPRIRLIDDYLVFGFDVGYFVINKFGEAETEHRVGFMPSLRVNYIF